MKIITVGTNERLERRHIKGLYENNNCHTRVCERRHIKGLYENSNNEYLEGRTFRRDTQTFLCKKWLVHNNIPNNYDHPPWFMIIMMLQLIPPKTDT